MGFPDGASGKEPVCQCRRHEFSPWVGKISWRTSSAILSWRRVWQFTLIFLPGESHGQRSWWATVQRVAQFGHDWSDLACTHTWEIMKVTVKNNCQVKSLKDRECTAFHTVSSCPLLNVPEILGISPSCLYPGLSHVRYFCSLFPSTLSISSILFYLTPTQLSVSYISISVLLGSLPWI